MNLIAFDVFMGLLAIFLFENFIFNIIFKFKLQIIVKSGHNPNPFFLKCVLTRPMKAPIAQAGGEAVSPPCCSFLFFWGLEIVK